MCFFSIVSQLQAEIDSLKLHLVFTQEVSDDLHSNVKAMKNATRKAGTEKNQAEEQKLKQVDKMLTDILAYHWFIYNNLIDSTPVFSGLVRGTFNKRLGQTDAADSHV